MGRAICISVDWMAPFPMRADNAEVPTSGQDDNGDIA